MKFRKTTSVLLLLSILLSISLIPCSVDASAQTITQSYLDEKMEEYDINGVVYVTKNGEVLCQSANGMANTAEEKEMTIDILFPIGSVSKQFCAAAVLLLQEQGKLSIDDTLAEYFPEYTNAKDVTIKNLLTMRSGILNHLIGLNEGEYTLSTDVTSAENKQAILEWFYTKELSFKPDTAFEYSNSSYFLLSIIVEKVSGQSYSDFIKENIFEPLEMTNSGFYEELMNHPDLAEHTVDTSGPIEPELKGLTQGCGDLVSNAKDMDKWMTSLRECTILSKESITEMTTNYSPSEGYGYGIGVFDDGGLFHNGGIVSYLSVVLTYPENNFNVFVVSNEYETGLTGIIETLAFEIAENFNAQRMYGDVNGDKNISVKDATLIQKFAAKYFKLITIEMLCADVNGDEKVNVKDATAIQKYVAKIETNLPIGEAIF